MNLHFDNHQFERRAMAVSADTKISWNDYSSMNIQTRKQSGERRLPTPLWATNDELLRKLLVVYLETRLGIFNPPDGLSLNERRDAAQAIAVNERPRYAAKIDELNRRYVDLQKCADTPPHQLKHLERAIENLDTLVRTTLNGGMDVVAAIVYFYYRARLDSVGVGMELHLKSPHVRQILYRLHQVWKQRFNEDGTEKPVARIPRNARKKEYFGPSEPPSMMWSLQAAILLRIFGFSFPEIGRRLGVKPITVYMSFQRHGIVVPVLKAAAPCPKQRKRAFDWEKAAELYKSGLTACEVARQLDASMNAVFWALRKMGVRMRRGGRPPKKENGKQRRARLKKLGLCTACGKRKAQKGLCECSECAKYYRDWNRNHKRNAPKA